MNKWKCITSGFVMFLVVLGMAECKTPPTFVVLARDGEAQVRIVQPDNLIPSENRAITELTNYLAKVTGAGFEVINEKEITNGLSAIYVGPTAFAKKQGIEVEKLGKEESVIRTVGNNLIITGGRPRGTLYGVYRFLEGQLGIRWFTPWCEKVPQQKLCTINTINLTNAPSFSMRDSYYWDMSPTDKPGDEEYEWWIFRNRLNGPSIGRGIWYERDWSQSSPLREDTGGGWVPAGPTGHSFWYYFPPSKYVDEHPDFYSMREGQRVRHTDKTFGDTGDQLCLTNKKLQELFKEKILDMFRRIPNADAAGIGANDGCKETMCDCPKCRAFVKKNGNETDLLMNFMAPIAEAVGKDFPGRYISTIASYTPIKFPPKTIKIPDNVISFGSTLPLACMVWFPNVQKTYWYKEFKEWAVVSKNMWIADKYCNAFISFGYLRPQWWQMDENIKLLKQFKVAGIFSEDEVASGGSVLAEFYEMRPWLFSKMTENADSNIEELMKEFLDGYYGKAAPYLFEYIMTQKSRRPLWPYQFVDYEYIHKGQSLFDQAEAAVTDQPDLLNRVKTARIQLDVTTLAWRNQAIRGYLEQGGKMETYPYKKDLIRSRLLSALESTAHPLWQHVGGNVWKGMYPQKTMREVAMMYVELISGGNEYKPFPEELKHYPVNSVVEIPLGVLDCEAYNLVSDPEALIGVAYKCPKKGLPASTCMYGEGSVPAEEAEAKVERRAVKGSGFQIYKANRRFKMGDSSSVEKRPIVYAGEGYPGAHVYNLYDPKKPNQLWELFVSAKVTGLDKGDQEAEIYYDCFYLVKTGGIKKTNQKQPSGKGNEK